MNSSSKKDKLFAIDKCISEYENYPYEFWLDKIGKCPIVSKVRGCVNDKVYEIDIDAIWDDKKGGNIRVMFTIWGGFLKMFSCSDSIILTKTT
jgi:hypothetical protein